jgi:branched-chain amino acid transport system substrate-binding protein
MAIEELNAKGVTIGGKKAKFELLAEDDAGDPKQGTAAAQKLVDSKVQGVIGHLNSGTTIPASKIYSDAGIPQISPSATNPKYTRQGYKTTFRVVADDVHLGGTLGKYAVAQLKGKSIAVIDDRTAYGQGVADEFEKGVKAAGGKTVGREFTNDKATDFTAILTSLKAKKPDIVFFGGMDAVAGPMLRQMKQLGIEAKFMGGDGICSGELPKLAAGTMADGQVVCAEAGGVEGAGKKSMDEFYAAYKKRFNLDVQVYAPYVYDAIHVMAAAMVKAGSSDPAKYLPVLAKTAGHKGVTGTIAFDEKGDIKNGALTLTWADKRADRCGPLTPRGSEWGACGRLFHSDGVAPADHAARASEAAPPDQPAGRGLRFVSAGASHRPEHATRRLALNISSNAPARPGATCAQHAVGVVQAGRQRPRRHVGMPGGPPLPGQPGASGPNGRCCRHSAQVAVCSRSVGLRPVDPGRGVVLAIGGVVAVLAVPQFVAGSQHWRALRQQHRGQQRALQARAQLQHDRVVAVAFDAAVPAQVVRMAIEIVFAVGQVVSMVVTGEIAQCEAVVRDHVVQGFQRCAALRLEQVGGTAQPPC